MENKFSLTLKNVRMNDLKIILILLCSVSLVTNKARSQGSDTLHLHSDKLELVISNQNAFGKYHASGYSGIAELYTKDDKTKNWVVPRDAWLNFEHIVSGDSTSYKGDSFSPRKSPMQLMRLGKNKVQLKQERTMHWPLQSTITYELKGNLIEMHYSGVPLKDVWEKHGYIGVFFASYINLPEELAIHFIGKLQRAKNSDIHWISFVPGIHGCDAIHRPMENSWDPIFDSGMQPELTLVTHPSAFEYTYPFYYGRIGKYVWILMFKNIDEQSQMRFAQSPNGAGTGRPAWDFAFFKKGYKINESFDFTVGLVIKEFKGREDVIRQYENWSHKKVKRNILK